MSIVSLSLRWHYPTGSNGLRQISRTLSLIPQTPDSYFHYNDKVYSLFKKNAIDWKSR